MNQTFRTLKRALPMLFCGASCFAQNTPIDNVSPGPHLFFEARNIKIFNSPTTPHITLDLYMSASQAYVDYINTNGVQFGLESVDVNFDVDFGSDGTPDKILAISHTVEKKSNQLNSVQGQLNMAGVQPAGYDTKFKYSLFRLPGSELVTTTPTHVVSSVVTWPAGVVIGTPGEGPDGAKIQLRCQATGYGTGPSGSKWGDLSGNSQNIVGSSDRTKALPVKLVNFVAAREGATAQLVWSTAEEVNSDRFEVERSANGKNWEIIATKMAKGESKEMAHYSVADELPLNGDNLYRLHMIDKDGTSAYSKIQSLKFSVEDNYNVYPNPVSSELKIKGSKNAKLIQIFNSAGKVVFESAETNKPVDVKGFTPGTYIVKLTQGDGSFVSKKVLVAK